MNLNFFNLLLFLILTFDLIKCELTVTRDISGDTFNAEDCSRYNAFYENEIGSCRCFDDGTLIFYDDQLECIEELEGSYATIENHGKIYYANSNNVTGYLMDYNKTITDYSQIDKNQTITDCIVRDIYELYDDGTWVEINHVVNIYSFIPVYIDVGLFHISFSGEVISIEAMCRKGVRGTILSFKVAVKFAGTKEYELATTTANPTKPPAIKTDEPLAITTGEPLATKTDEPKTDEPSAITTDKPLVITTGEPLAINTDGGFLEPKATKQPTESPSNTYKLSTIAIIGIAGGFAIAFIVILVLACTYIRTKKSHEKKVKSLKYAVPSNAPQDSMEKSERYQEFPSAPAPYPPPRRPEFSRSPKPMTVSSSTNNNINADSQPHNDGEYTQPHNDEEYTQLDNSYVTPSNFDYDNSYVEFSDKEEEHYYKEIESDYEELDMKVDPVKDYLQPS